jgi:hydrophobe/amphiphile efflux-1 (HAE1) family protein
MSFRFFIDRPIFATVIALVMTLSGIICAYLLPIAQFPNIVPPTVQVTATYNGADADTVAQVVTLPLEQQINGVEGMLYMSSTSTSAGISTITVTFEVGYDLDIAAVDVLTRVNQAMPQLPEAVQRVGVNIAKQSTNMTGVVSLYSPKGTYDSAFLSNYANITVEPVLSRVDGVGNTTVFGLEQYAMRIWLDPNKLTQLGLTGDDVMNAVRAQNLQASLGAIGAEPSVDRPATMLAIQAVGRLVKAEDFANIVVRAGENGAIVRLRDVGEVDLGSYQYSSTSSLNGGSTATVAIYQLPTANAFDVIEKTRTEMDRLKEQFPPDLDYVIAYDTTEFVKASLDDLIKTLVEAGILVLVTIYVFLQSFRATLIPMIAIPVSIIGTFAMMQVFGFSINTLTLLGLVLAIGLVVDDSIIVVENVYRQLESGVKNPKDAAEKAMEEVGGPIVATSSVLLAVFIPAALMPGITGQLYNQFALTIAFSIAFSSINSLTLSPALCGVFLREQHSTKFPPFVLFNRGFDWVSHHYALLVRWLCHHWYAMVVIFVAGCLGVVHYFRITPTAFVPNEDQGYYFVHFQLPPGASLLRTQDVSNRIQAVVREDPAVTDAIQINGLNFLTSSLSSNAGLVIVTLKNWDERNVKTENLRAIIMRAVPQLMDIADARVMPFPPPPIPGLSNVGGWQLQLEALEGQSFDQLAAVAEDFMAEAMKQPALTQLSTPFSDSVPMLALDIDRTRVYALGLDMSTVFNALGQVMGQTFINNYNQFGQVYNVMVQGEAGSRMTTMDVMQLRVKNRTGELVPFASFATASIATGTDNATHYNLYNTIQVNGATTAGYGSGDSIKAIDEVAAATLPEGFSYEWTGTTFQEIESAGLAPYVFGLAIVAIFLLLAALYESWLLPFNVLLAVSFAVLFALIALHIAGRSLDVYAQIGLVMLVGLAAKNAILIVEFAKVRADTGEAVIDAASEASRLRLRPIMMTSFAFILGILPLVVATGAGAQARQSIGITVLGGMLGSTIMDQLVVPTFFYMFYSLRRKSGFGTPEGSSGAAPSEASSSTAAHAHG